MNPVAKAKPKITIDPENARAHPARNKEAIRKSLERFGPGRSVVVDGDGKVLAGNGTVEQAEEMGLKVRIVEGKPDELIAIRRKDWSEEEARAYAIADNRSAELAEWDEPVLYEQLGALHEFDPEMLEVLDFDGTQLPELDDGKEYDESVADDVEFCTCPKCGHEFPK